VSKLFQQYYNADMPTDSGERDRHVAYLEHISVGFMVGAVARVMNPGCKHDHVPVVVSREQGLLKSTSILALCADPAWFSDNLPPDLADRDTKESLRGKWIIELSEIPHFRREVERLKAFISDAADRYRAPYGRVNQDHPRQCVFIGTSNDLEFADVTGNRRFWPFRISSAVDVEAILRDRDQLWAEAADLYRRGIKWWLPPNIEKIAAERQEAFVEADLWDGLITTWLTKHPGPFTMEDLFARDTGIMPLRDTAMTPRADEMRAARCLVRLGWHKNRCTLNGERAVWWQRKPGSGQWA
jgi:predicted P-loop ATPase